MIPSVAVGDIVKTVTRDPALLAQEYITEPVTFEVTQVVGNSSRRNDRTGVYVRGDPESYGVWIESLEVVE